MTHEEPRLIFDIGAHVGNDTEFYSGKGFRVVAVEANPALAEVLERRFAAEIRTGQVTVINKAVVGGNQPAVDLFVNLEKDDWSSIKAEVAQKNAMPTERITVEAVNIADLFVRFRVPYYLKIDVEMGDAAILESMLRTPSRPQFVSAEAHELRILALLASLGYSQFQFVNQWLNCFVSPVVPAREGHDYWPGTMDGHYSGLFGKELSESDWVGFEEAAAWFEANRISTARGIMRHSWFDVHATAAKNS